jgi:hypothetical protein
MSTEKKNNNLIGNRTRYFLGCSIVPQPTTLPRATSIFSVSQNIPSILWNQKIHCRFRMNQPLKSISSQMNTLIHFYPTCSRSILMLSSHLRVGVLSNFYPSGCPAQTLYTEILKRIKTQNFVMSSDL